jgi:F-type H+-transporting ATPase subunit delta
MNLSKISVRYARALYSLAEEKKITEEVRKDMSLIHDIFHSSRELEQYLNNPVATPSEKYKLIHKVFDRAVNPLTMKFLDLVLRNKRENHIRDIARMFLSQFKKEQGITEVFLSTAVRVDPPLADRLIQLLKQEKRKLEVRQTINTALIGGFVLRVDDLQIDASVATQLRRISRDLSSETYKKKI